MWWENLLDFCFNYYHFTLSKISKTITLYFRLKKANSFLNIISLMHFEFFNTECWDFLPHVRYVRNAGVSDIPFSVMKEVIRNTVTILCSFRFFFVFERWSDRMLNIFFMLMMCLKYLRWRYVIISDG